MESCTNNTAAADDACCAGDSCGSNDGEICCANCLKTMEELGGIEALQCCGRCKAELYCSPQCQKKRWKVHKKVCVPPTASRKEKKKTGKKKERPNLCAASAVEVRAAHARHKEREATKGGLTADHFEGMRDLDEELGLHSLMRDARVADPRKENRIRRAETREKDRTGVQLGVADDECPICLEAFGNHKCTTLPCGHVLHSHCFKNMRDQTEWCCPLCRRTYHADFLTCDQPSSVSLVDMWNGTYVEVPEHETSSRSGIMRFKNRKAVVQQKADRGEISIEEATRQVFQIWDDVKGTVTRSAAKDLEKFRRMCDKLDQKGTRSGLLSIRPPPEMMQLTPQMYELMLESGMLKTTSDTPQGQMPAITMEQMQQLKEMAAAQDQAIEFAKQNAEYANRIEQAAQGSENNTCVPPVHAQRGTAELPENQQKAAKLAAMPVAERAAAVLALSYTDKTIMISAMPQDKSAEILCHLEGQDKWKIFAAIHSGMSPHDRAQGLMVFRATSKELSMSILNEMPEHDQKMAIEAMPPKERCEFRADLMCLQPPASRGLTMAAMKPMERSMCLFSMVDPWRAETLAAMLFTMSAKDRDGAIASMPPTEKKTVMVEYEKQKAERNNNRARGNKRK